MIDRSKLRRAAVPTARLWGRQAGYVGKTNASPEAKDCANMFLCTFVLDTFFLKVETSLDRKPPMVMTELIKPATVSSKLNG